MKWKIGKKERELEDISVLVDVKETPIYHYRVIFFTRYIFMALILSLLTTFHNKFSD